MDDFTEAFSMTPPQKKKKIVDIDIESGIKRFLYITQPTLYIFFLNISFEGAGSKKALKYDPFKNSKDQNLIF